MRKSSGRRRALAVAALLALAACGDEGTSTVRSEPTTTTASPSGDCAGFAFKQQVSYDHASTRQPDGSYRVDGDTSPEGALQRHLAAEGLAAEVSAWRKLPPRSPAPQGDPRVQFERRDAQQRLLGRLTTVSYDGSWVVTGLEKCTDGGS